MNKYPQYVKNLLNYGYNYAYGYSSANYTQANIKVFRTNSSIRLLCVDYANKQYYIPVEYELNIFCTHANKYLKEKGFTRVDAYEERLCVILTHSI